MRLHDDWQWVLRKAWSIRFIAVAFVLSGAEFVFPFYSDAMPRGAFALMAFWLTGAAFVARLVAQAEIGETAARIDAKRVAAATLVVAGMVAVPLT